MVSGDALQDQLLLWQKYGGMAVYSCKDYVTVPRKQSKEYVPLGKGASDYTEQCLHDPPTHSRRVLYQSARIF